MRACAIVPSHNHWEAVPRVVAGLRSADLPVYLVDDGSDEPARSALAALRDEARGVFVIRLERNRGKGAAVMAGFHAATTAGFTHAVQADADGQHDLGALPRLLETARRHPTALVSGRPVYDRSAPTSRRVGRWITHVWVWIETLSPRIADSMCGFRVYPLEAVTALLGRERVGCGMEFDTEVMVRLFWRGVPVATVPVRVTYPPGNLSNFDLVRDNWRVSVMHTRLVLTMLGRLPAILRNRPPRLDAATHWGALRERGVYGGLRFCAAVYRRLGRTTCLVALAPVVLYFYATATLHRRASRAFLARALAMQGRARRPTHLDGYRHFMSFAARALDAFAAWTGGLPADAVEPADREAIDRALADGRGALVVVSHLGNVEVSRALLDEPVRARLTVLVHTRHAVNYNRMLQAFRPEAAANTIQVTDIGPETAIDLAARVARGEWVVIAGDRIPLASHGRVSRAPFLGAAAPFSHGPFLLAAAMRCPMYLLFCQREGGRYRLYFERFADRVALPRGRRAEALDELAARYAARLEHYCRLDPYQWHNFFDFWGQ